MFNCLPIFRTTGSNKLNYHTAKKKGSDAEPGQSVEQQAEQESINFQNCYMIQTLHVL